MKFIRKILNSRSKEDGDFFLEIWQILGFKPKNLELYRKAFTHRSVNLKDPKGLPLNYERLEFLGDTILGSIISHYLYEQVPTGEESQLNKKKSKISNKKELKELSKELKINQIVKRKNPN